MHNGPVAGSRIRQNLAVLTGPVTPQTSPSEPESTSDHKANTGGRPVPPMRAKCWRIRQNWTYLPAVTGSLPKPGLRSFVTEQGA